MTEFIGSRISLVSKRDIRYVGTLHEISSEHSTVALEQVVSFGTEGRRPDDEVPPSDNVYEYIVFRGSDVKDLRIEEPPKEAPQIPDDPAILGNTRRKSPTAAPQALPASQVSAAPQPSQAPQAPQQLQSPAAQQQLQSKQQGPPQFQQPPPFPYGYPPQHQRFGPQGYPPGPGFNGMPYGPPPGWYPPPQFGYPHMPPGQFNPNQMPIGPPGPQQRQQAPHPPSTTSTPVGQEVKQDVTSSMDSESPPKPTATVKLPTTSSTPVPTVTAQAGPPPPTETKPAVTAALAPSVVAAPAATATAKDSAPAAKAVPTGPKSGRFVPAVPLPSPSVKVPTMSNGTLKSTSGNTSQATVPKISSKPEGTKSVAGASRTIEEANRDARAAVAAAMAKLPTAPGQKKQTDGSTAMDNLTKKVNEMRTNDNIRTSRQPGTGGYAAGHRGGERGAYRGARRNSEQRGKKVEVPATDFDFASANAKFNKQDLVKEAIATGSPIGSPGDGPNLNGNSTETMANGGQNGSEPTVVIPAGVGYNKSSSFFDNISSETKDRSNEGGNRLGGREFRNEERQKNLETFGQGSVDNGYRGSYRGGRGRGRGFGRARGGNGGYRGRGGANGVRGGRGSAVTAEN